MCCYLPAGRQATHDDFFKHDHVRVGAALPLLVLVVVKYLRSRTILPTTNNVALFRGRTQGRATRLSLPAGAATQACVARGQRQCHRKAFTSRTFTFNTSGDHSVEARRDPSSSSLPKNNVFYPGFVILFFSPIQYQLFSRPLTAAQQLSRLQLRV